MCVTLPVSTTYLILGIVKDVSATLVATTHKRQLSGTFSNTLICFSLDNNEYNGNTYKYSLVLLDW